MYTCTVQFLGGAETLLSSLTNYEINEENITKFKQVLTEEKTGLKHFLS